MTQNTHSTDRRPLRIVIWGPGTLGGTALRIALQSEAFEVVGVRVFSPQKVGVDIGVLAGLAPIGVTATNRVDEILALDADCVVFTPKMSSGLEGMWQDVDKLLRNGFSVVSSNSHYCARRTTWGDTSQEPLSILSEVASVDFLPGQSKVSFAALRGGVALATRTPLKVIAAPLINSALRNRFDELVFPRQSTGEEILANCIRGNAGVHGTGAHPGYAVEQLGATLAHLLGRPNYFRVAESFDICQGPADMWFGLDFFGFGTTAISPKHPFRLAGDVGYGDPMANLAHEIYGIDPNEIEVTGEIRGLPSVSDLTVSDRFIAQGSVGVLHMTQRGTLDDRFEMVNEECWFAGKTNTYRGTRTPFPEPITNAGYIFEIKAGPVTLDAQVELVPQESVQDPWSVAMEYTANALLESVPGVVDNAPGIVASDARPAYAIGDTPIAVAGRVVGERVQIVGSGSIIPTLTEAVLATGRTVTDTAPDVVIAFGTIAASTFTKLLASGTPLITDRPVASAACPVHVVGSLSDVVAQRLLPRVTLPVYRPYRIDFVSDTTGSVQQVLDDDHAGVVTGAVNALGLDPAALTFETSQDGDAALRIARIGDDIAFTHRVQPGALDTEFRFTVSGPNAAYQGRVRVWAPKTISPQDHVRAAAAVSAIGAVVSAGEPAAVRLDPGMRFVRNEGPVSA